MKNINMMFIVFIVIVIHNRYCYAQVYDSVTVDSCWEGKIYRPKEHYGVNVKEIDLVLNHDKKIYLSDSILNKKTKNNTRKKQILINANSLMQLSMSFIVNSEEVKMDSIIYHLLYANAFQNENQLEYNLYVKFLDSLYFAVSNMNDSIMKKKISRLMLVASIGVGLNDFFIEGCKSNFDFDLQEKANRLYANYQPDICCDCFLIHPLIGIVEWTDQDLRKQLQCLFSLLSLYSKESSDICCILMLRTRFFTDNEALMEKYNGHNYYDR